MSEAIDNRIAGKNPADALPLFSTQIHNPPNYIRNTASWCYDLRQSMTCISPWNGYDGIFRAGTAITAQHIINSAHYELDVDNSVRFVTEDNVVVQRMVRGKARHPGYVGSATGAVNDLTVYTLDAPLPASITPCKMLPPNYADYLSYLDVARPPTLVLDQEEKAHVRELVLLGTTADCGAPDLLPDRIAFLDNLTGGDSGNPVFLIINNSLVLLSTLTYATGTGTFVTPQISTLNAMIADADTDATARGYPINTGLQVQTTDLSGFNTYSPP